MTTRRGRSAAFFATAATRQLVCSARARSGSKQRPSTWHSTAFDRKTGAVSPVRFRPLAPLNKKWPPPKRPFPFVYRVFRRAKGAARVLATNPPWRMTTPIPNSAAQLLVLPRIEPSLDLSTHTLVEARFADVNDGLEVRDEDEEGLTQLALPTPLTQGLHAFAYDALQTQI